MICVAASASNAIVAIRAGIARLEGGRVISEARMRRRLVMRLLGILSINFNGGWDANSGIVALRYSRVGSEILRSRLR